jgi:hypothetical protein
MRSIHSALGISLLFVLTACNRREEPSPPAAEDSRTAARLEDAPFAKGPGLAAPFAIPVRPYDLVYDPYRERVYASLNGPEYGLVVRINPTTGEIDGQVRLEGGVGPLALSPDGSRLWAGVQSAKFSGLCRIDVETMTAGKPTPLDPKHPTHPVAARLVMLPGTKDTVVASLVGSSRPTAAVYDAGVVRAEFISEKVCSSMVYSGEGETFFAFNNKSTGFELQELLVTDAGIRHVKSYPNVFEGFESQSLLTVGGGRIIGVSVGGGNVTGKVFDIKTRKLVHDLPGFKSIGIDERSRRLYLVNPGESVSDDYEFSTCQVEVRNLDTYEPGAAYALPPKVRKTTGVTFPAPTVKKDGPQWLGYYGGTCRPVLMLGESVLVVNRLALTFLPVADILKGSAKKGD